MIHTLKVHLFEYLILYYITRQCPWLLHHIAKVLMGRAYGSYIILCIGGW